MRAVPASAAADPAWDHQGSHPPRRAQRRHPDRWPDPRGRPSLHRIGRGGPRLLQGGGAPEPEVPASGQAGEGPGRELGLRHEWLGLQRYLVRLGGGASRHLGGSPQGTASPGQSLTLICYDPTGQSINGYATWDQLSSGLWVYDGLMNTPREAAPACPSARTTHLICKRRELGPLVPLADAVTSHALSPRCRNTQLRQPCRAANSSGEGGTASTGQPARAMQYRLTPPPAKRPRLPCRPVPMTSRSPGQLAVSTKTRPAPPHTTCGSVVTPAGTPPSAVVSAAHRRSWASCSQTGRRCPVGPLQ